MYCYCYCYFHCYCYCCYFYCYCYCCCCCCYCCCYCYCYCYYVNGTLFEPSSKLGQTRIISGHELANHVQSMNLDRNRNQIRAWLGNLVEPWLKSSSYEL